MALTRFRLAWRFDGQDARIASRAIDETGYVQPTRAALIAARGTNSIYHYNGIKVWHVRADGTVTQCGGLARSSLAVGCGRDAVGAVASIRRGTAADAGRDARAGFGDRARWHAACRKGGDGRGGTRALRGAVRALSWPDRGRRRGGDDWWVDKGRSRHRAAAQDGRQLLAVRDDAVGLRQSRDAIRSPGLLEPPRCTRSVAYVLNLNGIIEADR